jgi:hypothetical protein
VSTPVIAALALGVLLLGAAGPEASEPPDYEVFIEPGLTPELSPSQIVPRTRGPFGGMRMGGTIHSIEVVALVRGQNVPLVDPDLSAEATDVPVWVIVVGGDFHFGGPGDFSSAFRRAFYLVHHRSGEVYGVGSLPDVDAPR